ncbi:hypothetical protein [Actinomadura rupiterrae]|uniref:hypothetical protein n=1 Tax=Actinomadura rupiterrae TaxID=559627 RepID=UPI0020A45B72|nr:hypothetical protein [Actinomadura rupiterrae]MCP2342777.1 hypothetical protein [Actinomadura rupiterrae]
MTDLYTVSFDGIEDRTLTGRVHLRNPDAAQFSPRKAFPLQLLMDAWSMMLNGFSFEEAPFTREEGVRRASEAKGAGEMRRLEEMHHGKRVWVDAGGYLLEGDSKKLKEPKVKAADVYKNELDPYGGQGMDNGRHYLMLKSKPQEFARQADGIILAYELGPQANLPKGQRLERMDEDAVYELLDRPFEERPYAPVTVKVSSPRYLEPLAGGMRWSTAYSGWLPGQ